MEMVEELMSNPYAWLFLSLCTVASFVFAIYTWINGKKTKEISIDNCTNEIVKMGKSPINKLDKNCHQLFISFGIVVVM